MVGSLSLRSCSELEYLVLAVAKVLQDASELPLIRRTVLGATDSFIHWRS